MARCTNAIVGVLVVAAVGCSRSHDDPKPKPVAPAAPRVAAAATARPRANAALATAHANYLPSGAHGVVPVAHDLKIDGEWIEPAWNQLALSGVFVADDGKPARPVSQVRLLADGAQLYVALYAADEDIRSTDHFDLTLGALTLALDPHGNVTPPTPGVRAAVDTDGTIDQPRDDDEEWLLEIAVPYSLLGPRAPTDELAITAARCDVTKDGVRRCGRWATRATLPPPTTPQPPTPPQPPTTPPSH